MEVSNLQHRACFKLPSLLDRKLLNTNSSVATKLVLNIYNTYIYIYIYIYIKKRLYVLSMNVYSMFREAERAGLLPEEQGEAWPGDSKRDVCRLEEQGEMSAG